MISAIRPGLLYGLSWFFPFFIILSGLGFVQATSLIIRLPRHRVPWADAIVEWLRFAIRLPDGDPYKLVDSAEKEFE